MIFVLLLCYFFVFEQKTALVLLENGDYTLVAFSDEMNGGQSRVIELKEEAGGVTFDYQIGDNEIKYAGFNFILGDGIREEIGDYNQVTIEFWTQNLDAINFSLKTWEDGITIQGKEETYRVSTIIETSIEDQRRQIIPIHFSEFKTPDWWVTQNKKRNGLKDTPDWARILQFSVLRAAEIDPEKPGRIIVSQVLFERTHFSFYIIAVFLLLGSFLTVGLRAFLKKKPQNFIVTYKSVEIDHHPSAQQWEDEVFNYLGVHYIHSELKLEQLAKAFSQTERTVSALIHDRTKMTFKQYLNSIRINEAKRLLLETELSIKEITYEVGYTSPHSFRRVFKQFEGLSPSEFRDSCSKK